MSRQSLILDGVLFAFTASLLMSTQALSDPQETTFYDNVEWTKNAPKQAYNDPNMTINLSDFCAEDSPGCESQIRNPAEAGMSDVEITDKSTTEYYSNEQAKAIQDNFDNNSYTLDPNDDTYRFATLGIDNAYEISHGQSNQFVDCQSGSQCIVEHSERTCTAPTYNSVPCYSEPVAKVEVGTTHYQCPTGWTLKGTTCHGEVEECRFDYSVNEVTEYKGAYSSLSTTYFWDGKRVSASEYRKGALKYSNTVSCGHQGSFQCKTRKYEICGPVPVEEPASMTCDAGYTLSGAQCIKNTFTWKSECSLPGECQQVEKICIEGEGTRTINGIPTYLDCWKYQLNHVCDLPNGCDSLPNDCEAQAETSCSLMLNGVCVEQIIPHICSEKQCSETSLLCGEESFCLDGDCFEEMPTTDDSFDESASALAALAEAADGIGDPPMIFTGNSMQCTDKAFGFADCCKDSGWGVGIGLDQCNEEEKALGQAKEQGVTISLGSYCASSFLGACTRKKKTYCIFDSKLARIIQEQGVKGQLGIGLGSAKNPICGAITPEQLQEIDFELIDFSDFYGDMHDNANVPSEEEIKDRLQSAYGN